MENIEYEEVGKLPMKHFAVPLYRVGMNPYFCVRDCDLPEDLALAFGKASAGATCPAPGAGYLHDFESFMAGSDPIAMKYSNRLDMVKVDVLKYRNLEVPVWQVVDSAKYEMYSGSFVRAEDLPEDLRKAFNDWQTLAACPGWGMSYLHDFVDFMDRSGRGWSGDFSAVVNRYK